PLTEHPGNRSSQQPTQFSGEQPRIPQQPTQPPQAPSRPRGRRAAQEVSDDAPESGQEEKGFPFQF
ncbi:MAG TPA: hypothetical protein PK781_06005, partial [Terrimesophilobacter sp.]|nr:hypothetical protein [Terrimesophilobacter sp.]